MWFIAVLITDKSKDVAIVITIDFDIVSRNSLW